jgi:hypothetical protein
MWSYIYFIYHIIYIFQYFFLWQNHFLCIAIYVRDQILYFASISDLHRGITSSLRNDPIWNIISYIYLWYIQSIYIFQSYYIFMTESFCICYISLHIIHILHIYWSCIKEVCSSVSVIQNSICITHRCSPFCPDTFDHIYIYISRGIRISYEMILSEISYSIYWIYI